MAAAIQENTLLRNYPLLSRIEWHLSMDRHFAFFMDHIMANVRRGWYNWRRKQHLIPESLTNYEEKRFSQNGEDGILREIFRRIGEGSKYSVEFGIEDGAQCCTRELLTNRGWQGDLLEGSPLYAQRAKELYSSNPSVRVATSFITEENILDLFRENSVPSSPDLLVTTTGC